MRSSFVPLVSWMEIPLHIAILIITMSITLTMVIISCAVIVTRINDWKNSQDNNQVYPFNNYL